MTTTIPIPAAYVSPDSFTVAADKTAEFVAGVRILADCGVDGARYGTVMSAAGTTVTLAMDSDGLTTNLVGVLHGNDTPQSLPNHGHTGPADGGILPRVYTGTTDPPAGGYPAGSVYIKYGS